MQVLKPLQKRQRSSGNACPSTSREQTKLAQSASSSVPGLQADSSQQVSSTAVACAAQQVKRDGHSSEQHPCRLLPEEKQRQSEHAGSVLSDKLPDRYANGRG